MATLKELVIEEIKNNTLIQQICSFEIDDGYVEFNPDDPNLAYFTYSINKEKQTIEVTAVNYQAYYDANGTYDIVVPATLGNYTTILNAEI